jgi:hypothetical protein
MEMIPPPGLEINIFVTNFKSIPDKRYSYTPSMVPPNSADSDSLLPPAPGYVHNHHRSGSADSIASVDEPQKYVDLSYYTAYGDEDRVDSSADGENYILDLTNFDGENDTKLPGEEAVSRRVMKDGKLRRAKTREAARAAKQAFEDGADGETHHDARGRPGHRRSQPSADSLLPHSRTGRHSRLSSEIDLRSTLEVSPEREPWSQYNTQRPLSRGPSFATTRSQRPTSYVEGLDHSRAPSPSRDLEPNSDASIRGLVERDSISGEIRLEVDKQEMKDVSVVAEHARPGKPKLDRIIADEVLQSRGPVIVACEFPIRSYRFILLTHISCRLRSLISERYR